MRIWHEQLLPYLPELQFKGQLRELVAIMHDWRDKGSTNHLLINKVLEYEKSELSRYFLSYEIEYKKRYGKWLYKYSPEFVEFAESDIDKKKYFSDGWHTKEYLRICMANLYEKYKHGIGRSKISEREWQTLLDGYKKITGEEYEL